MVLEIIGIVFAVIILSVIINAVEDYSKQNNKVIMSFRESMDLTELPVVTFFNGDKKLNFLLDTGSTDSHINSAILPLLDYKEVEGKDRDIIGVEGNRVNSKYCEIAFNYKGHEFINEFCIYDLSKAFATIKEESGVQIHGILGNQFFQRYKYILDFENLIAYYKK